MRGGIFVFSVIVVFACCSDFWISLRRFLEQLRNCTGSFLFDFLGECSVATTQFCGWVPLGGDVWLVTVVWEGSWVEYIAESYEYFLSYIILWLFPEVFCQTTSAVCGSFEISVVSDLSHAASERRLDASSLIIGLQVKQFHLSCFEHFSVGLNFVLPVVNSGEVVYSLRLLQSSVSLWNGKFYQRSQMVSRQV